MTGDTDPCLHPFAHPGLTPCPGSFARTWTRDPSSRSCDGHELEKPASSGGNFAALVLRASHHSSRKPILFHTTHPASLHASHHSSYETQTTRLASPHASHHTSCKPISLQTTHPGTFTPLVLEADLASHHSSCKPTCFTLLKLQRLCKGRSDLEIAPVLLVRCPVPPKLSASSIALSSDHRDTAMSETPVLLCTLFSDFWRALTTSHCERKAGPP